RATVADYVAVCGSLQACRRQSNSCSLRRPFAVLKGAFGALAVEPTPPMSVGRPAVQPQLLAQSVLGELERVLRQEPLRRRRVTVVVDRQAGGDALRVAYAGVVGTLIGAVGERAVEVVID